MSKHHMLIDGWSNNQQCARTCFTKAFVDLYDINQTVIFSLYKMEHLGNKSETNQHPQSSSHQMSALQANRNHNS
jgi:hypothetical protein